MPRNSRVSDRMFRLWTSRFNAQRIDGLADKNHPGRLRITIQVIQKDDVKLSLMLVNRPAPGDETAHPLHERNPPGEVIRRTD